MTAYFDKKLDDLSRIRASTDLIEAFALGPPLDALDSSVVWDCTIAAQMPGFPEDLRREVHRTILKFSVACQPPGSLGPVLETPDDHISSVGNLISDLHTVFHDVAQRSIPGFSDDPRTPLRMMYLIGSQIREQIAEELAAEELAVKHD